MRKNNFGVIFTEFPHVFQFYILVLVKIIRFL